ncbi:hypothetical protein KIN20_021980 [Parelaphostrongylus tenuis]|uniref:Uncharacterized protein n=1 Tax=Parelaphostrongylus tenuis TaxID=148309 RepID=A0AAD5QUW2_PARTN|nr:hypothetical protein KIN20_021980 [Parelaphostrongylus tenuis]
MPIGDDPRAQLGPKFHARKTMFSTGHNVYLNANLGGVPRYIKGYPAKLMLE